MKPILWTDEWSVGNSKLDQQHKNILKIINRMIELQKLNTDPEIIFSVLNDFQIIANEHLHYEEYLLKKYDYPDLENHKNSHRHYLEAFYTQLFKAREDYSASQLDELTDLLTRWWSHHICEEDMQYRNLFKQ